MRLRIVWVLPVPGGPCTATVRWAASRRTIDSCASLVAIGSSRRSPVRFHASGSSSGISSRLGSWARMPASAPTDASGSAVSRSRMALQEPADHPLARTDEQHPGVMDVRTSGRLAGAHPQGRVEAEPAQRAPGEVLPLPRVPRVDVDEAGRAGEVEQVTHPPVVQLAERVGLEPGRALRHHGDRGGLRVVLDRDRRGQQRIADLRRDEHGVAPDQLHPGGVDVDPVPQVVEPVVQVAGRRGGPVLPRPRQPLLLVPAQVGGADLLGRPVDGVGGQRRRRVGGQVPHQVAQQRRRDRRRGGRLGPADPQPAAPGLARAELAARVGGQVVLPVGVGGGHGADRLLEQRPYGQQIFGEGERPFADRRRGIRDGGWGFGRLAHRPSDGIASRPPSRLRQARR